MREHPRTSFGRSVPLLSFVTFLAIALWMLGCTYGAEPKHPSWKSAAGAEQFERLMWQAIRDKDWSAVEAHLAPTFVGVDASGQAFDRAGWVEHWKHNEIKGFSLAEVNVQPAGASMIVSYLLRLEGPTVGPAASEATRTVSVWQQVKSGWVLATTTSTPVVSH